ncbi:MAG: fused MFS/spermidine synthase [Planctomycetota bacterium]|nr:fused MFS/spermidine synthase [Planctomycetota bacterium]
MLAVFLLATFSAATLLFLVQPMIARQLLPTLGGVPAVWNTCMVFFQVVLVLGYGYAHILTRAFRRPTVQIAVHTVVLIGAIVMMPIGVPAELEPAPSTDQWPAIWVLGTLIQSVGVPFFAVASAGPLLQRWFSRTDHRWAADPYFLYAASNAGSMLALLAYPLLVEPNFTVSSQLFAWSVSFGGFGALALASGHLASRRTAYPHAVAKSAPTQERDENEQSSIGPMQSRLRWLFFALVPSSLMLGVTQHISTDVAPTPLLWVLPLAIYLLTYLIAFTGWGRSVTRAAEGLLPTAVLAVAVLSMLSLRSHILARIAIHLGTLLIIGLTCHGRLAEERPKPTRLTEFYLLLSIGGALGGMFNALLAPMLFDWVAEYPIILVIACLARQPQRWRRIFGGSLSVPNLSDCIGLAFFVWFFLGSWATWSDTEDSLPLLLAGMCLLTTPSRWRFAAGVVILFTYPRIVDVEPHLHQSRTFFGVYDVTEEADGSGQWHHLFHGTTHHGSQYSEQPWASQPTVYYTLDGPVGDLVAALDKRTGPKHLACVGLGCGTLATLGEPGWKMTFFEIDPEIRSIATNPDLFHNIRDSKAEIEFVIGDARLEMAKIEDRFDMIILDAFSSDAIPVHLLTKEAVRLYLEHLKPGGILAFHVTNRYLDLPPVLASVAHQLGVVAVSRDDSVIPEPERIQRRKFPTEYVAIAKTKDDLRNLADNPDWSILTSSDETEAWTDDYSNLFKILKR